MELLQNLIEQVPASSEFTEFRRLLVQVDRETSRKKSLRGLSRILGSCSHEMKPYVATGLAMGYFFDRDYAHTLFHLKDVTHKYPLSPISMYAATMIVLTYRTLGMKRERFEAEGSRLLIMKKIAMQSSDPLHRILALNELKKELEARELHDEAQKCDLELNYWNSVVRKKKVSHTTKQIPSS